MLLEAKQRTKLDNSDDSLFYSSPRFVTHLDEGFIDQLTNLYRDRLQPNTRIFDMMGSWVSHLPEKVEFAHVEGHGMNEEELAKNRQINHYFVHNFNQDLKIPLPDKDFDAVLNCASIQYLQYPDAIFYEIHRILKPGGIAIISFSNRMFYDKAIAAWRDNSEEGRVELVKSYFESVKNANGLPGFSQVEVISQKSNVPSFLQALGLGGGDPFYVVIAYRQL